MTELNTRSSRGNWLDRGLRIFGDVRAGEGVTALLLLTNLFLVLVAYYIIKTVREPMILATGGAELKIYAGAVQALVLMFAVPLYSYFVSRVPVRKLIWGAVLFFVACIGLFYVAILVEVPMLGFIFYVWVGVFSVAIIAQFWSFANDVYPVEKGERLFPLIAIGATAGAPVGAWIAKNLFASGLSVDRLLLIAGAILLIHLAFYVLAMRRPDGVPHDPEPSTGIEKKDNQGAFSLVFSNAYLRTIAFLLILLNLVNTTGEYLLSGFAKIQAEQAWATASVAAQSIGEKAFIGQHIGVFYGDFFFWVNVAGVLIQALLVSRIVKHIGIAGVLFALPLVALGTYAWVAIGAGSAGLGVFRWLKTAENSTDYSVMNTAKAMLWLPTTREEKYKAKQAIDTFFVRLGDVFAALLVYVGITFFALGTRDFAIFNVVMIVIWFAVAWALYRKYKALTANG